ncbi:MAG: DUF4037 domain-containing protein [Clostridium sp.]|nr:DUF4037 domain-containing protein [Clostridium sp.]
MIENILKEIAQAYSKIDSVYAVVLSGSRTSQQSDELSDYDIYVYSDKEIPVDFRTELAKKYSDNYEIDNRYFETGDEWNLRDYPDGLDFMFRDPKWIEGGIENVWTKHNASLGYTTCFLHNVYTSKILYDKNGWFLNLQNKLSAPYPKELKSNILKKNMMLLKDKESASFLQQIENAVKRNDIISIQHRTTAFLACYFDIIFALNEVFHPGEKRLINFVRTRCKIIPEKFEENLEKLFNAKNNEKVEILNDMVINLKKILPDMTK